MLRRLFGSSILHQVGFRRNVPTTIFSSNYSDDVSDLLSLKEIGKEKIVKGWVKAVHNFGEFRFIHVSDGTSSQTLQVVADESLLSGKITYGSCISAKGELVKSPAKGQLVELKASEINLFGPCDTSVYPFNFKENQSDNQARVFPHLRLRTKRFGSLMRLRNAATMAVHQYFQNNGYCFINTPIITSNDCEGAGEVFEIKASQCATENSTEKSQKYFFSHPAFLTVSGQLHLEAVTGAFKRVYTFGPTFRADDSNTRHHLSEFYMIEAEVAFLESLDELTKIMEDLIKSAAENVLTTASEDFSRLHKGKDYDHKSAVEKILISKFLRLSYDDAVTILEKNNKNFQFKVSWGCDFQKEHEKYLVSINKNQPVFITDFPVKLKPFYARENDDKRTSASVDLLFPGVGEMFGGTLREERYDKLEDRLKKVGMLEDYQWYLELRKFGGCPHGGFGLGFERFLQWLLDVKNIRDVIPFPRSVGNCKL